MPAPKTPEAHSGKTSPPITSSSSDRKPWKKKTPVEVFLDQAEKLKKEITEAEADLATKRRQLQKFEEAKKLFEST